MPVQPDDLLLSLQSSLRNALSTFGSNSPQYRNIKLMVDEHTAKLALESLSISSSEPQQQDDQKMQMG
ncbi:Nn.00g017240.m01.CDS01 [Neocucurbitaria sp. VM-36]